MGVSFHVVIACLILLAVLFIFATPVQDLQPTALRAKQLADSILLGLVYLAAALFRFRRLNLRLLSLAFGPYLKALTPTPCPSSALSCVFRC